MVSGPPRDDVGEDQLRVTAPKRWAAGMPGVIASVRALRAQTTAPKAVRTMLRINQPEGFDCPGCAWPEPHDTARLEFCENGAKAVAEEATDRRVTAAFFAAHAIAGLAKRSDYWLGQQGRLTEPVYRPPFTPEYWSEELGYLRYAMGNFYSLDGEITHYHNWFERALENVEEDSTQTLPEQSGGLPLAFLARYTRNFMDDYERGTLQLPETAS